MVSPTSAKTDTVMSDIDSVNNDLPKHIPVDMGIAPRTHPYEHHTVSSPRSTSEKGRKQHRQHSLSPEQLGVVGYVRDVAGFVKDTVQDIRETQRRRRSSSASRSVEEHEEATVTKRLAEESEQSPPPPAQQQLASTPLANVVTGLFPGIGASSSPSSTPSSPKAGSAVPPACTHAEALRQDLKRLQQSPDKEHRLL